MKSVVALAVVAVSFSVLALAEGGNSRLDAIKGYRSWFQATEQPTDMSPRVALSCVGPRPYDQQPNPHVPTVFVVYVNKTGRAAMLSQKPTDFPVGSVIVKEKYPRSKVIDAAQKRLKTKKQDTEWAFFSLSANDVKSLRPELCTVMVKTKTGWDYFAVDQNGKVMDGDTSYCRKCHEDKAANDYVFRPYAREFKLVTKRLE